MCEVSFTQKLLAVCFVFFGIELESLSFDVLLSGELSAIGVDISDYPASVSWMRVSSTR